MEKYSADHILIAFGSLPVIPVPLETRIRLIPMVFFTLKSQPKKATVAGTGYIAVALTEVPNILDYEKKTL